MLVIRPNGSSSTTTTTTATTCVCVCVAPQIDCLSPNKHAGLRDCSPGLLNKPPGGRQIHSAVRGFSLVEDCLKGQELERMATGGGGGHERCVTKRARNELIIDRPKRSRHQRTADQRKGQVELSSFCLFALIGPFTTYFIHS